MANPGSLLLKLIIDGTSAGAVAALTQAEAAAKKTAGALGGLDAGGGMEKMQAGLNAVEERLKSLQAVGRNALAFAGIGLGIGELIQLADAYSNMTGRLKLVTQYTGDFKEVFGGLADSARATRSDLGATVDLYTKMEPALQGIGLNGKQSIGVITAINQAIGLSGASSQAAAAALMQLGQGFGSGVLRGEELNSILEQTPGLAQAIADGLGVPIGALRKLGEEGQLTAESVAGALQKMAPQLEAEFAKMPMTVGQSLTVLKNEFLSFIGATDNASGGTSALAAGIAAIAEEFRNAGPIVTAFSEMIKVMVNGLDGLYRMLKIVGLGLGGYAAAAQAAMSGDFSGAKQIWQDLGSDIDAVLQKPLLGAAKVDQAAADSAKKRQQLEAQLAGQIEKLQQQSVYIATGASDQIAAKEKENIDKRVADQQRLVEAVRAAWQASLKEAEDAAKKADGFFQQASSKRASTADKVFNAQTKGMSTEEKAAADQGRAQELYDKGSYYAAAANSASLDGRFKAAEQYQKQAEQFLQRAETFADKAGDVDLIQKTGDAQASLLETQAKAEQAKADKLQAQAANQAKQLNDLQAQLTELEQQARAIDVKVDVTGAATAIKGLQTQLDGLKDKTVTVTVNTVNAGSGAASAPASDAPGRAFGGPLPGSSPHDRADNLLYWGTAGEWVIQRPTVRYYGADFMRRLNAMQIPRHAFGGQLGESLASRLRVPSLPSYGAPQQLQPTIIAMPDGRRFPLSGSPDVVTAMKTYFLNEALRKGGRPR